MPPRTTGPAAPAGHRLTLHHHINVTLRPGAHAAAALTSNPAEGRGDRHPRSVRGDRPPWTVGTSLCLDLPGFRSVDKYPIRSPLVIVDYLASRLGPGGQLAEVGTRNGDVSDCIARTLKGYIAIERTPKYCNSLVRRGITVLCKDFDTVELDEPELADLSAFFWFVWPPQMSERWLRRLWKVAKERDRSLSVFIGFDGHIPEDMRYLPLLLSRYNGSVDRLFFDEGGALTDRHSPSYAHPNLWRPGRWGIVHVAHFELGPLAGSLPQRLDQGLARSIHKSVRPDWSWEQHGWEPGQPVP